MASLEPFVLRIKPAMDAFLRNATKQNLNKLENELAQFNWIHMSIFNIQILVPLVLKLEELSNDNQDLRTGCLQCITLVTSKVYLKELTALRTMLVVVLKQVRECDKATTKTNLSEEIKLASVQCIAECFRRSTSDVLEQFYTKDSAMILGQILLTLVEFVEREKYKKLVLSSLECLMIVFYVHDEADRMDVVLRNQVANTIFIFLPKIVTVLYQIAVGDETIGETIKISSVKALGRILCVIYEETTENLIHAKYDAGAFKRLLNESLSYTNDTNDNDVLAIKKNREQLEQRMKQLQGDGRTQQWIQATSKKLRIIFTQTSKLRSHTSTKIRKEYAEMCCLLMETCSHNLKENFVFMLETVVALTEDEDVHIRNICCKCVDKLQNNHSNEGIFDENSELLLDEHLTKLPRIIARCDDTEQYTEFTFLKGFLNSLSSKKLQLLLSIPHNLEIFCMCLLLALDLQTTSELLIEGYSLREMDVEGDYLESSKFPWRKFKNLNSERCVKCLHEICCVLGTTPVLNRIIVEYLLEMLQLQNEAMNEILLILLWLTTAREKNKQFQCKDLNLVKQLLDELLDDKHWHLSLEPDNVTQLKVNRHTDWFIDRTPGLYESAVEIRTQDCDSDDETVTEDLIQKHQNVTINDAEFNVLHTCIVLDCLGHCALYVGERFDGFIFQTLHKVLLKLAHSNSMVYKASNFALVSIQNALRFNKAIQLIESHIDYITYHLNMLLKKTPECKSAVDILSVVLQFSSRNNLPHLEVIFETIYNECSKQCETDNVISYLKVFNAFLKHLTSWLLSCNYEINDRQAMYVDDDCDNENDLLNSWLEILNTPKTFCDSEQDVTMKCNSNTNQSCDNNTEEDNVVDNDPQLPRHILMIKTILQQVIKFLTSSELQLQILSLECLTCGIPLLRGYDNELLPLIHLTWSPLVEKFRQKNALVLNRCFSLLEILATYGKDFITKRSLDDVMPFLKNFLQQAAVHSAKETITVQTQEYKLQLKLLEAFPNLIKCLDLDGKHLNDISEIISIYLSKEQPKDLQIQAIEYFRVLRHYNGPLIYLIVIKKSHLKMFQDNIRTIIESFNKPTQ
ncbi:uncharacterized protein LOC111675781 [Lucilia cuprina]|uniref:uncharacterized protein LOC111675781 n=1 Tax=Lucilia cuprina TaxID=7375 RepID=UPI001F05968F|nr:uncharacterized protein LOC111675781 [Lucilia cuprina]